MSGQIPVRQVDPGKETASEQTHNNKNPQDGQTVELYASRKKIYVREVKGFYQRLRTFTLWGLMGMYFLFCWIQVDGQQLIHFDLPERQFHLFGATFWPQDFMLLSWMLIIAAFGLFFITTLFGRVWCGYTCPQTVWTFIFMWLEERIEGSRNQRMKLDKAPTNREKVIKKTLKHASWVAVAFATGLTFVGYFYPIRDLAVDFFTLQAGGWAYFWVGFFTLATYGNAGWLREQVCLYMCPYARFQSVMFDRDTKIVSYDYNRGEPRGSRKKNVDHRAMGLGDCIDCGMCVHVCPTGIDIRDGLQYECIGCALCIDACDQVMDKMNYPRGLIRYSTENELEGRPSKLLRPRSILYAGLLAIMVSAVVYTILTRVPVGLEVLRDRGSLFQMNGQGRIENYYTVKVQNMSDEPRVYRIDASGLEGLRITTRTEVQVRPGEVVSLPTVVEVPPASLEGESRHEIRFSVTGTGKQAASTSSESRFLGPAY